MRQELKDLEAAIARRDPPLSPYTMGIARAKIATLQRQIKELEEAPSPRWPACRHRVILRSLWWAPSACPQVHSIAPAEAGPSHRPPLCFFALLSPLYLASKKTGASELKNVDQIWTTSLAALRHLDFIVKVDGAHRSV